jgi:hypothetical protein
MQIAPAFFRNSLCRDLMDLGEKEIDYFVTNASQNLKIRLLHLEVWAHVCLYDLPADQMLSRLCDNIEITPYN